MKTTDEFLENVNMFEPGRFLEIRQKMNIDDSEIPISYGQIFKVENGNLKIGLYDHKRRFVKKRTLKKTDVLESDSFRKTSKSPREISWEFRKELGM